MVKNILIIFWLITIMYMLRAPRERDVVSVQNFSWINNILAFASNFHRTPAKFGRLSHHLSSVGHLYGFGPSVCVWTRAMVVDCVSGDTKLMKCCHKSRQIGPLPSRCLHEHNMIAMITWNHPVLTAVLFAAGKIFRQDLTRGGVSRWPGATPKNFGLVWVLWFRSYKYPFLLKHQ